MHARGPVPSALWFSSERNHYGDKVKTRTLGDKNKYPDYGDLKREQEEAMEER